MRSVRVAVVPTYDILIGAGAWENLGDLVAAWRGKRAAIVTDQTVGMLYGARVAELLQEAGILPQIITVPVGEASKSMAQLGALYDAFLDLGITRGDLVIALGGGMVGDLAGFAAASYLRGVPFMQLPTTLLAQVDSSVGGKVAVNLPRGKNLVGAFYQPVAVCADLSALATLDARQIGCGLGEIIKTACIADAVLFDKIERAGGRAGLMPLLPEVVARCCEIKADYVRRDAHDHGARMELNFGHTIGHALEAVLGYGQILHGEAVCIGMLAAAREGERLGVTEAGTAERLKNVLAMVDLPTDLPRADAKALIEAAAHDKKSENGTVKQVLLTRIGEATLRGITSAQLGQWIEGACHA